METWTTPLFPNRSSNPYWPCPPLHCCICNACYSQCLLNGSRAPVGCFSESNSSASLTIPPLLQEKSWPCFSRATSLYLLDTQVLRAHRFLILRTRSPSRFAHVCSACDPRGRVPLQPPLWATTSNFAGIFLTSFNFHSRFLSPIPQSEVGKRDANYPHLLQHERSGHCILGKV